MLFSNFLQKYNIFLTYARKICKFYIQICSYRKKAVLLQQLNKQSMKRYISFFILVWVLTLPQVAQAQWRIGVSGGADYNWYSVNTQYQTDYHYDGSWGWSAAVFTQYNFLDWVGLRAELEATEHNYRFYRTGYFRGTNYITHCTYLQLPVMTQFSFGGTKVRGFVSLGVYAGYWVAGMDKGTLCDPFTMQTVDINAPYAFQAEKDQRWDFGLAGGLGLEYRFLEHWALHLEGRCYYSFISRVKPYMRVKDNRYNTTVGINLGFAYIF